MRAADYIRWNAMLADAWVRDRWSRRRYRLLDERGARAHRTSDTVFVFGSGYSLNELSAAEWKAFARHDVFGFNAFYYQRWIPVGFHLLRGGIYGELRWRPYADEVSRTFRDNPLFANTVFVMQEEYFAQFANQMIGYRLMPEGARLLRYRTARGDGPPTRAIADGLRHETGTLADSVNCAYCLGWTEIVLVGVDLYDSRYFYLPPEQTVGIDAATALVTGAERNTYRGNRAGDVHPTAANGVVDLMRRWRQVLNADGIELSVYNPRSLLRDVLPVYRPGASSGRHSA
jgi:hypothetical protein